jgi:hypothetical protein
VVVESVCCRDGPQFTYSNSSQNGRLSSAGSPVVSRRNSSSSQSSRPSSTNDVGVAVGAAVTVLVTNKIFLVDAGAVGVAAEDEAAATADEEIRAALKGMPDSGTGGTLMDLSTHRTMPMYTPLQSSSICGLLVYRMVEFRPAACLMASQLLRGKKKCMSVTFIKRKR